MRHQVFSVEPLYTDWLRLPRYVGMPFEDTYKSMSCLTHRGLARQLLTTARRRRVRGFEFSTR
jgi:hypothetical protein